MANKKVTIMVIKVNLNCEKCKKKIKKILCEIPQIQNQIYDEKANTVTITVVCCSPEKITKMICCKGGDSIKGIEIKEPEESKQTSEKSTKDPEAEKLKVVVKVVIAEPPKEKPPEPTCKPSEPATKPPAAGRKASASDPAYRPPETACCRECYEGYGGGPCYEGHGRQVPCYGTSVPCYGAYERPVYDSCGGGNGYYGGCRKGCYVGRCDCLSEENPSACSVM